MWELDYLPLFRWLVGLMIDDERIASLTDLQSPEFFQKSG
jgi:hypothetical protein